MNLSHLVSHTNDFAKSPRMPVLFVGHGNPMNAIEQNNFTENWKTLAKNLPKPQAILCVSAHWETKGTWVTAMDRPKTIHDFGGFPQALFDVQYPAPGDPTLAHELATSLAKHGIQEDHSWGLDHGTWSILYQMYPKADIPVIQLSLDYTLSARHHFELAESLSILRERGVLIIGSGNMVHNLGRIDWQNPQGGYDWANEANASFKQWIEQNDQAHLFGEKPWNQALKLAVPSTEHYNPMLYSLGLKHAQDELRFFNDQTLMGSLSMTSFILSSTT